MSKKNRRPTLSDEEIRAKRTSDVAEKMKAANALLAAARQEAEELGITPGSDDAPEFPEQPPYQPSQAEITLSEILEKNPAFSEALEKADGGTFRIYKLSRGVSEDCGTFNITEFPDALDAVVKEVGGGTFRIVIRMANGSVVKTLTQTYNTKIYRPAAEVEKSTDPAATFAPLLAAVQESNKSTITMLTSLLTALLSRPPETGMFKTAQDVASIAALFKGKEGGGDFEKMLEVLQTGIDMGKSLGGDGRGEGGGGLLDTVLKSFMPAVRPLADQVAVTLAKANAAKARTAARPAALPRKLDDAPPAEANPPAVPGKESLPEVAAVRDSFVFKLYAPKLLDAAKVGASVVTVAEKIMAQVPEAWDGIVYELVSAPNMVEILASYAPEITQHAEWFKALAAEILKSYDDAETPDAETPPAEPPKVVLDAVPAPGNGSGHAAETVSIHL